MAPGIRIQHFYQLYCVGNVEKTPPSSHKNVLKCRFTGSKFAKQQNDYRAMGSHPISELPKTFYKTQNYILGICALHFKLTGKMAKMMKKQTITFKETISNLLGVLGV